MYSDNTVIYQNYRYIQEETNLDEMKAVVFCTCILMCASFISAENESDEILISEARENLKNCFKEYNFSRKDVFTGKDIDDEVHNQPEMKERRRLNGCVLGCFLKKHNLMVEGELKEEKILEKLPYFVVETPNNALIKVLHDCIEETKNVTPECEKVFVTSICFFKNGREHARKLKEHKDNQHQEEHQTT